MPEEEFIINVFCLIDDLITERLVQMLDADRDDVHLIDGFPIEVCKRVRAKKQKIFNDEVSYG